MGKMRLGKKGSFQDLVFIAVGIFAFALMVLLFYSLLANFSSKLATVSVPGGVPTAATTAVNKLESNYKGVVDYGAFLLVIGLFLVAAALASMVRIPPVFLIFYIIALIFLVIVSAVMSNVYQTAALNDQLSTQAGNLHFIPLLMNYLPFIVLILGSILAIVMYKNWGD